MVCSNSTTIGAGLHILTFRLLCSKPELWPTFYVPVRPKAACAGASSIFMVFTIIAECKKFLNKGAH